MLITNFIRPCCSPVLVENLLVYDSKFVRTFRLIQFEIDKFYKMLQFYHAFALKAS